MLYFAGDVLASLRYEGYSYVSQTVSELSAVGAPTRPLVVAYLSVHWLFVIAFGVGVWRSASRKRALRVAAGLLIALGAVSLVGLLAPMRPRGAEQGFTGTMHAVAVTVGVLLIMLVIGFGAAGLGRLFRSFSILSLVAMAAFGFWAATYAQDVEAGLPTPWVGVIERVSVYAYVVWLMVFAFTLMRHSLGDVGPEVHSSGE